MYPGNYFYQSRTEVQRLYVEGEYDHFGFKQLTILIEFI